MPRAVLAQGNLPLMVLGGPDNATYLGCFYCNNFDAASVCNKYGEHGSRFSGASIWNKLSPYGSRYSDFSPWNPYGSGPPALVDRQGNFHGYLTANVYNPKRVRNPSLLALTQQWERITDDPEAVADAFCKRE